MGMMAAAATSPAWTDSRLAPCSSQSSSQQQGLGDEKNGETAPTKMPDSLWKSEDTASTLDDGISSTDGERENDASSSTDEEHEDYNTDTEDEGHEVQCEKGSSSSSCTRRTASLSASIEADLTKTNESGFACEVELEDIGKEGLVNALANVLSHLASLGSGSHSATLFHAATPPEISIRDYLARIAKYYYCSNGCFILGLIYIDRILKMHPDFVVSKLNIHRLLSTSIMLAAKFNDDVFYSNKYYGKVAGVRAKELNVLEENLLQLLNWRLHVLPDEYEEYLGRVLLPTQLAKRAEVA